MSVLPIVGAKFRPPAALIMAEVLFQNHPLRLQREPSNPHDPNAIKVVVEWGTLDEDQMTKTLEFHEVSGQVPDKTQPIHLGYVPRAMAEVLAAPLDAEGGTAEGTFSASAGSFSIEVEDLEEEDDDEDDSDLYGDDE